MWMKGRGNDEWQDLFFNAKAQRCKDAKSNKWEFLLGSGCMSNAKGADHRNCGTGTAALQNLAEFYARFMDLGVNIVC